jgi:hypothetical protein
VEEAEAKGDPTTLDWLEKKKKTSKKSITDWSYYIRSAKQASEFEANKNTKFLLNYIREQFKFGNNIAKAIDDQEPADTKI